MLNVLFVGNSIISVELRKVLSKFNKFFYRVIRHEVIQNNELFKTDMTAHKAIILNFSKKRILIYTIYYSSACIEMESKSTHIPCKMGHKVSILKLSVELVSYLLNQ